MSYALTAIGFGLFVWWFTTGVIIYLDGLPQRTFKWTMLGTTVLLAAGIAGLYLTRNDPSVMGAYVAFGCGVLAWGWQEVSFYTGYVTGPRREACEENCSGWRHFGHAVQTSLYHELAIIAAAGVVIAATWGGTNQVGRWTFLIMWWMHQSAKLNVFFGVRNLNEEFLPEHLRYLKSFFTKRAMNLFFPVSVTVSTLITGVLIEQALQAPAGSFERIGAVFLASLMVLAILEHWLLVLPLPAAALWKWGLHSRKALAQADVEVVAGFLGAGKTTFLRRVLASADRSVRTVVLVNDFGEAGVDASLLGGNGADVVELPNGCICCSLRADLERQIREMAVRFAPQRILIEPSGVAEVPSLLGVLHRASLADIVKSLKMYTLIDAGAFLRDYERMPAYFEAQARLAPVLIINKTDLVSAGELRVVEQTLRALSPHARIVTARFGLLDDASVLRSSGASEPAAHPAAVPAAQAGTHARDHHDGDGHDHEEAHGHEAGAVELGLMSWSRRLDGVYDEGLLQALLERMAAGDFGELYRAKGIVRVRRGWVRFDLAGGHTSMVAFIGSDAEAPRAMAIGRVIEKEMVELALEVCQVTPGKVAAVA